MADERFQVDLRGLMELLSQHLYSGPKVFVRELLQNGVDAITERRRRTPGFAGAIEIELVEAADGVSTLIFRDDGIGLTEAEVVEFLATIGRSSKRGPDGLRGEGFIGQFGIGLLSCFMVTDEIVMISQSAKADMPPVEWRGRADGTYSLRTLGQAKAPGTEVYLRARAAGDEYFQKAMVRSLVEHYGAYLPATIRLVSRDGEERLDETPPWERPAASEADRESVLAWGSRTLERSLLDVAPMKSRRGGVEGLAFILAEPVRAGSSQSHVAYLKRMLLTENAGRLLPDWAFFVQCVLNCEELKPTASREAFYEDEAFEATREELGECLRQYLIGMANAEPWRFQHLLSIHHLAIKALAAEDEECLRLFSDWLPFETTFGTMTLGEFCRKHRSVRYATSHDQFRQIAQVAAAESIAVINAGFAYDVGILQKLAEMRPELEIAPFEDDDLANQFEGLTLEERSATLEFERLADATLQPHKCQADVTKFQPASTPALYMPDRGAEFFRSLEAAKDESDALWQDVLGAFGGEIPATYARLHLNYLHPLVRRISGLADRRVQQLAVETLYVQSRLLGHFPLTQEEQRLMTDGLAELLERAMGAAGAHG